MGGGARVSGTFISLGKAVIKNSTQETRKPVIFLKRRVTLLREGI
jgi:hypothetical protein